MKFGQSLLFLILVSQAPGKKSLSFNRDIRPILSDKCFACHGFDEETREGELRLDTPEGAFKKKRRGKSPIVAGKPDESEAWLRIITKDEDDVMPPPDSHKQLTLEEKSILRQWIQEGAEYQRHWAFVAPVKAEVPGGEGLEIDRFVGARLTKEGMGFSPEADRPTLIRRVSFALIGLPPTIEDVEKYVSDQSADAFGKMVDRVVPFLPMSPANIKSVVALKLRKLGDALRGKFWSTLEFDDTVLWYLTTASKSIEWVNHTGFDSEHSHYRIYAKYGARNIEVGGSVKSAAAGVLSGVHASPVRCVPCACF